MSIFMGGKCVEPARTGCCAQNLSDDITGDVILWYCLIGVFIEMAILEKEKENAESQWGLTDCLLCKGSIECSVIVQFKD